MSDLPYDEILQAVTECIADLDRADEIANGMLGRLFAPMERLQDIQETRAKAADLYAGQPRRAFENIKGQVATTMPKVKHESNDRTDPSDRPTEQPEPVA